MRFFMVVVLLFVVTGMTVAQPGSYLTADAEMAMRKQGWDDAWGWGNTFVVKNHFDQVYYPHATALLDAEKQLSSGAKSIDIAKSLSALPGIKGAVIISDGSIEKSQWPEGLVKMDTFTTFLNNCRKADNPNHQSPMMHRTVGGKVKNQIVVIDGKIIDLMVRYVHSDSVNRGPGVSICLVMDKEWLSAQVPVVMDSLYRENGQLLYSADSPTNHLWEQSLGVIADKDTLWWTGRKDVKIRNVQAIWPFYDVEVHSYVHTLEKK